MRSGRGPLRWRISSAWACHTAILALTTEPTVDSQNGFHMAAYADFSRANLLKIENSFQVHRCDRETLFVARQYDKSHHPDPPPLRHFAERRRGLTCARKRG